jgi:hypothetical protein
MSPLRPIICILAVLPTVILFQGARGLVHQREAISSLHVKILIAESRLRSPRHDLLTDEQELSAAEGQLSALRAQDAGSVAESRSRQTATAAWIARVRRVQRLFNENPEQRVPDLRLLTAADWLRATLRLKFDNPMSDRYALLALRTAASARFSIPLQRALDKYARATHDAPPASIFALAPFFDDHADVESLARFEIISRNTIYASGPSSWLVNEKRGPDPGFYNSRILAPQRGEGLNTFTPTPSP